ncbi:uncharacterized protein [Musca autumnalis]|uniref:uncharacterized protein n=1 Tax=Musca autumnalis TaxID=221902 RepID=UPI003CEB2CC9
MAEAKPRFAKLNNSNYANWKFRIELLLRKQNLWKKVIEGSRPQENRGQAGIIVNAAEISDWEDKDDEARGTIGLLVMDDQLCHIRHLKTAKETWNALKEYHERNTLTNKVFLMRSICSLKLEEGGDAVSHINDMNDLFTKLRDIGEEALTDKWSAAMLLSSLPESYDTLITSLESRKEEEITFAFVQQRVIAEFERRLHANGVSNDAVMKVADNSNKTCFFCKKPGHQKKNCAKYKNWKVKQDTSKGKYKVHAIEEKQESPKPSKDFLFNFGSASKGSWLIDSGATSNPKVIRSDRGGEYTGKRLQDYLKSEGIQVQFTTPYSPQQNGKAERKNRTLVEMGRCLLIDADLPKSFWGEAVSTANYIQNRVLTRATKTTPYELWYGKKPDISNLHIFGSKCFVHIPSEKRQKLDSTANKMIFLGYDANSKGYRCYDASKNKVVVSRDVRFTEIELRDCSMDFPQKKQGTLQIEEENLPVSDSVSNSDESQTSRSVTSNQENEEAISNVHIQEESENEEEQTVRVSKRSTKGIAAKRLIDEIWMANHESEPKTYDEAINSDDKDKWFDAMQEEIKAMRTNNTWDIVPLPEGRKALRPQSAYATENYYILYSLCSFRAATTHSETKVTLCSSSFK